MISKGSPRGDPAILDYLSSYLIQLTPRPYAFIVAVEHVGLHDIWRYLNQGGVRRQHLTGKIMIRSIMIAGHVGCQSRGVLHLLLIMPQRRVPHLIS